MLWTISTLGGSTIYILIVIVPLVLISFIDPKGTIPHLIARYWARFTLRCANTQVHVEGLQNIPAGPAVYMSNHQSHFDVLAILGYLAIQFRWTVKKELFRIPLFGLGMARAGYIKIDRGNHERAMQSMDEAACKIRGGSSIVIFPEGTRSRDGKLILPFKKGGFHLSLKSGVPVVPITVVGSRDVLAKNARKITPGRITMKIGSPIESGGHDVSSLMEAVRQSLEQGF